MCSMRLWLKLGTLAGGLLSAILLLQASPAHGQARTNPGGSGGSGLGGGSGSLGGGGALGGGGGTLGSSGVLGGGSTLGSSGVLGTSGGLGMLGSSSTGTGTRGGSNGGISSTNPLQKYYVNPLGLGLGTGAGVTLGARSGGTTATFGQPTYGTQAYSNTTGGFGTTGRGALGGLGGGLAGVSGSNSASLSQESAPVFGSSFGVRRAPDYIAQIDFPYPRPTALAVRMDLQQVIQQSSRLPSRQNIQVFVDGNVAVLQGRVVDDHERRLAESLVRLTPGVMDVRNELKLREAVPTPQPGP